VPFNTGGNAAGSSILEDRRFAANGHMLDPPLGQTGITLIPHIQGNIGDLAKILIIDSIMGEIATIVDYFLTGLNSQ
jgi:hypothetical protein